MGTVVRPNHRDTDIAQNRPAPLGTNRLIQIELRPCELAGRPPGVVRGLAGAPVRRATAVNALNHQGAAVADFEGNLAIVRPLTAPYPNIESSEAMAGHVLLDTVVGPKPIEGRSQCPLSHSFFACVATPLLAPGAWKEPLAVRYRFLRHLAWASSASFKNGSTGK